MLFDHKFSFSSTKPWKQGPFLMSMAADKQNRFILELMRCFNEKFIDILKRMLTNMKQRATAGSKMISRRILVYNFYLFRDTPTQRENCAIRRVT